MSQDTATQTEGESVKYLKAIMLLQLRQLSDEPEQMKLEVLLANAGFKHKEIAEFLGRNHKAVSMTLSRARQQQVTNGTEEQ